MNAVDFMITSCPVLFVMFFVTLLHWAEFIRLFDDNPLCWDNTNTYCRSYDYFLFSVVCYVICYIVTLSCTTNKVVFKCNNVFVVKCWPRYDQY